MAYFLLALAFTLNGAANILLKIGSEHLVPGPLLALANLNWQLVLGLLLFACNIIFYALALRALPLSLAYPVMAAMGFLIVNGYALWGLHEAIAPMQVFGYVAIIVGLILVVSFSHA